MKTTHNSAEAQREMVVLVHGLWMTGLELWPLRRRLHRHGLHTRHLRYPSVRQPLDENAYLLYRFVKTLHAPVIHYVGHSLGGLVIARMLQRFSDIPPGRAVALGSPLHGSRTAHQLARWHLGNTALGRSLHSAFREGLGSEPLARELGVIAGDLGIGLGRIFPGLPTPNDGVVSVAETRLPQAGDHRIVRATHLTLLFSAHVPALAAGYLRNGKFSH